MKTINIYTIGHATRGFDEFVGLLGAHGVDLLVDVRSVPRSLKNPQFNEDTLARDLKASDIGYMRLAELGGFRAKSKTVPLETNAFWQHNSFHSYADYAMGEGFRAGLEKLIEQAKIHTPAIMCAEMLWWRCHRRIITDYLLAHGISVFHIIHKNKTEPARITPNAQLSNEGVLCYPLDNLAVNR